MAGEVDHAAAHRCHILLAEGGFGHAAMHFQRPNGGDDDHRIRGEAGDAAFDVDEFLGAEIGTETGLGDHHIAQMQAEFGGHDGVAAMGDIGEGAAMHQSRGAGEGLHQIGREGIAQQGGHGALGLEVLGGDGGAIAGVADDDAAKPGLEIGEVIGQAENGHHLGGDGDVEAILARETVAHAAQALGDLAQGAVIHVECAAEGDAAGIEPERIAPVDVVVQHRRQQIMGGGDGVEIAGEMEVDILHRHHLGMAAAGRTALDAKAGAEGGFAQADHGAVAQAVQRVAEAHGGGGFAFAGRGGADAGDQDELAGGALGAGFGDEIEGDFGLVFAVGLQRLVGDAGAGCDGGDGGQLGLPGDLEIYGHGFLRLQQHLRERRRGVHRAARQNCRWTTAFLSLV